jgi:ankyrin repeat protein
MYQYGDTPLIWAARYGYLPMVEYLVERGADVHVLRNVNKSSRYPPFVASDLLLMHA